MKTLFEVMTSPSQRIFKDSFSSVHCTSESVKLIVHCTQVSGTRCGALRSKEGCKIYISFYVCLLLAYSIME